MGKRIGKENFPTTCISQGHEHLLRPLGKIPPLARARKNPRKGHQRAFVPAELNATPRKKKGRQRGGGRATCRERRAGAKSRWRPDGGQGGAGPSTGGRTGVAGGRPGGGRSNGGSIVAGGSGRRTAGAAALTDHICSP